MPQTLLQKQIQKAKTNLRTASGWIRGKIKQLQGTSPTKISRDVANQRGFIEIGSMYFYFYDPKWKKELPYYDIFPLTIVIEKYSDGFLGLNLHYLPSKYRMLLLDKLMDLSDKNLNYESKLKISYSILNSAARYKEFKPCVKKYLYSHIRSKYIFVQPEEWQNVIFLPVERFKKSSKDNVWRDSLRKI